MKKRAVAVKARPPAKRRVKASTKSAAPKRRVKASANDATAKRRVKASTKDATATAARKTTTRKPRAQRSGDGDALREAVRAACSKQFERLFGRPWDASLERFVRSDPARLRDQREALEVHDKLRGAIEKAVEFVKRPRDYPTPLGLDAWVPRWLEPLLARHFLRKREAPADAERALDFESERHRLIAKWDAVDFLGVGRPLDATEFALLWLLGGSPSETLETGATPASVIKAETSLFSAALREQRTIAAPTYRAHFEQNERGRWLATVQVDAGRTAEAEGATLDEAHQRLREALSLLLDETPRARRRRR